MITKTILCIFPRAKYPATASGKIILPRDRARVEAALGNAVEIWFYTRVYARDTNVYLDFDVVHGCLGNDSPSEALRSFALTRSGASPSLPRTCRSPRPPSCARGRPGRTPTCTG